MISWFKIIRIPALVNVLTQGAKRRLLWCAIRTSARCGRSWLALAPESLHLAGLCAGPNGDVARDHGTARQTTAAADNATTAPGTAHAATATGRCSAIRSATTRATSAAWSSATSATARTTTPATRREAARVTCARRRAHAVEALHGLAAARQIARCDRAPREAARLAVGTHAAAAGAARRWLARRAHGQRREQDRDEDLRLHVFVDGVLSVWARALGR